MIKNYYKNIALFIIASLLLFGCETKTNWYENFREKEKSPFGTFILYNEVKDLYGVENLVYLKKNIYDYLYQDYDYEKQELVNYICVKSNANKLNDRVFNELIDFVSEGNNAFISLNYFSKGVKEFLEIETKNLDSTAYRTHLLKDLKGKLSINKGDNELASYSFDRNIRKNYFTTFNDSTTTVIGTQRIDSVNQPNFLKIKYGKGNVFVHTQPIVFTNYFLLKENRAYAEDALSFLPSRTILWDPQIRNSNLINTNERDSSSVFKYFLEHPPLKWALYLAFFSLLLFMIFNARRKQRAIPIISNLKNSTVEFAHTIANLYLKEEDYKNAADKKIKFFLEKIRTKYLLNTNNLNSSFIEKLAVKSGNKLDTTRYLINKIKSFSKRYECTQMELIRLNNLIEKFLNKDEYGRNNKQ